MQIVIDIPEAEYDLIVNDEACGLNVLTRAIANGTPLPKGHGDLIDRNAVNEEFYSIYNSAMACSNKPSDKYLLDKWSVCLDTSPTIIEADEVEE